MYKIFAVLAVGTSALGAIGAAGASPGFEIGGPEVISHLGEPMRVRVPVLLDGIAREQIVLRLEAQSLPAPQDAARSAGLHAAFESSGDHLVLVSSVPVREPLLGVTLTLDGGGQTLTQNLWLMFDPPPRNEPAPTPTVPPVSRPSAERHGAVVPVALRTAHTTPAAAQRVPAAARRHRTAAPGLLRMTERLSLRLSAPAADDAAPAAEAPAAPAETAALEFLPLFTAAVPAAPVPSGAAAPGRALQIDLQPPAALLLMGLCSFAVLLRLLARRAGSDTRVAIAPVRAARRRRASRRAPSVSTPAPATHAAPRLRARHLLSRVRELNRAALGEDSLRRRLFVVETQIDNGALDFAEHMLEELEGQRRMAAMAA